MPSTSTSAAAIIRDLLASPDLNLEGLEPATVRAIENANAFLKATKPSPDIFTVLGSLLDEIDSMRSEEGKDYFGGFFEGRMADDLHYHIEWPNLTILADSARALLPKPGVSLTRIK